MAKKKSGNGSLKKSKSGKRQDASDMTGNKNQWTVMVYMAGDNTLAGESVWALTEIKSVEFSDQVEAIALFDSIPPEVKTQKFVFNQKTQGVLFNGRPALLEDLGKDFNCQIPSAKKLVGGKKAKPEIIESASDYRLLQSFLETSITKHPAEKYLLVLSGHGSGAVGDFLTSNNPKGSLSITDLKKVLTAIKQSMLKRKIDILGMDSCLMSMVEVGYEVRNSVELLVGSEGFEPETGWPYRPILTTLNSNPTMGANQLAETIVDEHTAYYKNFAAAGLSTDQSVCDLTQMSELADAIKDLAELMMDNLSNSAVQDAILLAHWRAQSYQSEQYTDLWDFCELLQGNNCPVAMKMLRRGAKIIEYYMQHSRLLRASFQHSCGCLYFSPGKTPPFTQTILQGTLICKRYKMG